MGVLVGRENPLCSWYDTSLFVAGSSSQTLTVCVSLRERRELSTVSNELRGQMELIQPYFKNTELSLKKTENNICGFCQSLFKRRTESRRRSRGRRLKTL